jgi:hypothetical protein
MEKIEPGTSRQPHGRVNHQIISGIQLLLLILLVAEFPHWLSAQPILYTTIRGTVTDKSTQSPLVKATIVLLNSNPLVVTSTDTNGNFTLSKVPIGRRQF